MADDIVQRLRQMARANGCEAGRGCSDAAAEIERLRAERDAERALADRLAVALAAQGSASFDEGTNLNIKRLALDAFKEARRG